MDATLREYGGIKDPVQALQPLREGQLAEMQSLPGFIAYYLVDVGEAGDRRISLSVFESSEAAVSMRNRCSPAPRPDPFASPHRRPAAEQDGGTNAPGQ